MTNVVYRGKSITFPEGMSEAEISQAMPSIADQIDADFSSQETSKVTPEKSKSFSDRVINTAKDAADYIKDNAIRLPLAIADELRTKSVVDGMDGKEVKPDQAAAKSFKKAIDKNKKQNVLEEGAEVVDGISGVAKVGLNRGYAGLGKIEAGFLKSVADLTNSETLAKLAEGQNRYADKVENRAVLRGKPVEGFAKESIVQDLPEAGANAISSVIQTAPALGVGAASGGSALPALFGGVALQEYNEGRERDLSPLQSATRAIPMAGAEVVGEKLGGFDKVAKGLRKATQGNGIADLGAAMLESSLKELPAEELTTTLQFLVDKTPEIGLNQDATFDDYKKAVKDTALATILQSGGMSAGGAVLTNIAKKLDAPVGTAEADEIDAQLLAAFNASQQQKQDQAKQDEADTALANITNPDASIDDAIALAEKAIDIPFTKPNGLLNTISAQEAIPASDILGDDNVSADVLGATGMVDSGTVTNELDNAAGSAVATSDGINADEPSINRESVASDIPAGNGSQPDDALIEPDYSTMSYEQLQQAREDGMAKNKQLDLAVIRKYAGDNIANEAINWPQRKIDKWFESNATGEMENESSAFKGVNVEKIDQYANAITNFDESTPQALGNSIALKMRDIDKPGFEGSPEFVSIKNALAYSKEQGWNESEVIEAMRDKAVEYAGRDAPELFERLFKIKPQQQNEPQNIPETPLASQRAQVQVAGQKIDKEWTAFSPESGTLNIPRAEMPQVKAEHRGAMVNFLNARGVDHTQETVPASSLKPTQQEFSEAKVKKASKFAGGDRSILVSADNHVLDGHHQWLSKLNKGDNVDVIRLNAPIAQLLNDVKEFPSSTVESGASTSENGKATGALSDNETVSTDTTTVSSKQASSVVSDVIASLMKQRKTAKALNLEDGLNSGLDLANKMQNGKAVSAEKLKTLADLFKGKSQTISFLIDDLYQEAAKSKPAKSTKPKAPKQYKPKTLLATLRELGGVSLSEKRDVTGEDKGFAPGGYNQIFKKDNNRSLKVLIESGDLDDYLPYNMRLESNGANDDAFDSTEAYDYLADKIRNGESVLPYDTQQEIEASRFYENESAQDDIVSIAEISDEEVNKLLQEAGYDERENGTESAYYGSGLDEQEQESAGSNSEIENVEQGRTNSDVASGEREESAAETNAGKQAEVGTAKQDTDLLGENTTAKQAIADAERAKDAKRNSGNDNQDTFTLTGSNSEADIAAAAGAQDLFRDDAKMVDTKPKHQDEVDKAAEALTAAGVKGKEKLDTIKDVREGKVTADEVADAYGEPAAQKPKGNVDDFGEKLEGARKDMVRAMAKEYSDDELASLPLSKIWPITDVNLIDNKTAAAIAWTAREEIPSKPRKPYALKVWVGKVKTLRDIGRIVSKALEVNPELMLQKIKDAQLGQFKSKVALLEAIDRDAWKRIGKVEEYPNAYSYVDGVKQIKPMVRIDVDGVTTTYEASSVADVIDNVNEKLGKEKQEKRMAFEVRGSSKGGYFINKKGDKNYTKLKDFDSSKEAFEFLRNNYDEVVAAWDATKDRLNVKESDVRGKENRPRTGEDYRKGKDVSSEEFATTFGFRGIQFGEWVKQGGKDNDRQGALNAAYDALMDLANIVGVPPKAMSLEGTLGLSFGARGKGSAAAHFEPGNLVINLTKTQGAGTLAHEWFHALDNYFSRKRGGEKSMAEVKSQQAYREGNYITYKPEALYINKNYGNKGITKAELERYRKQSPNSKYWSEENWIIDPKHPQGVRPEVEVRFADLVDALNTSPMKQRARSIDGVKEGTDGYWSRIIELGARAFENYVIHKMQLNGYDNDYLANVVRVDSFNRDSSRFPYLLDEEVAPVAEAFDNLFGEIQTKESDSGNVVMFSRSNATPYRGMDKDKAQSIIDELQKSHKGIPKVKLVDHHSKLPIPSSIIEEINGSEQLLIERLELVTQLPSEQNIQAALSVRINDVEGLYSNGEIWINTNAINSEERLREVFAHEAIGHMSVESMLNEVDKTLFPKLLTQIKTLNKSGNKYIRGIWDDVKESQPDIDDNAMAGEVLAFIAERGDQDVEMSPVARSIWQRLIDGIKAFAKLVFDVEMTDVDVRDIVSMASRYAKGEDVVSLISNKDMYYSRNNRVPSKADGDTFLTAALEFTARNEDFFENAPSDAKEIADIASDMNTQFRVEPFGKSQTKLDGADTAWEVFLPNAKYRSAVIYEKGNEVWINVSRLRSGADFGTRIYSLAAAYAYNNDKVFIGDPLGLTAKAFYRRAENMLSSALKYGTTKHIEPHVAQTDPDLYYSFDEKTKDFGEAVRKIDWKKGNDAHNIKELIYTVYHGAITNLPELKNVIFNPTTQGFTTISGEQFTDDDFERVLSNYYARTDRVSGSRIIDGSSQDATVNTTETSNPYRAGIRTAKRAAFYNTFLRKQSSEERTELLGSYVRELQNRGLAPALQGVMYSRSKQSPQASLTPQWQVDESSKMDNVIRALQDKYIDLKRVTQEIKKSGTNIADRWNAYLQEELYHGRSAKRVQDFIKQDLTPLIEDMRMRGVGMADFEEYLWMRHAPERNKQIATINPDMQDGGAGVTTAEANSYMAALDPADKRKYEALAKRIDAITAKSRQVLVDYGLESQSIVNAWQSAYQFYVPLMREDMERGTGNGTGSGFKVKGNSSKRAMGSNRAVVDVIANIAQQYEKNVVRGEKNRVATAMIGLAKLNPNEEFWNVETPPTIRHVSKATGLVETRTDPSYKNRNNVIVARIVNKRGEIEERSVTFNEFNDRAMKMALSLNNLDVDQVSAVSNFMGNITRYFSSINTQYNPIFGIVNITRDTQGAMLNLSTTEIAGKQKEVLANIMPALRGIYAETRTDNGIKSPMQFGSFTEAQKSKAQEMRALWEEYQREGGTTGFRDMYANAEERTKAVSKALDPNWWTKTLAGKVVTVGGVLAVPETALNDKLIKPIFYWLSDYNQTLENAVRLAAYKVAIDSGISKQQAASIGKNLTVNFNRKGTATRTMGAWYAFFNAAVQGTARIGETLTGPKGKQIIAGGISIGVAQALMLAMAGFDEDEPPEFVRSSNFIIPIPNTDQKYITIPMPLGFNVLPNFGRITTEWLLSGAENTTERVFDIFGAVMESFNPLGGNGRIDSIIMPTVADPFNDLSKNEDWTGRNIAQEDFSNLRPTPGYTRTRDKATELSIELARWINNLSGGDDYEKGQLSPTGDQIEYLTGQLTGGVGREVVKTVNTIESIVTGEDLPTYKIPLVGRFVGNSAGQAPQAGKFYNNLIKLNKLEAGYLGRLKDGKDADEFLNENPELNYVDYGKKAQSAISKLRDYKRDLVKEGANREEVKLVDEQITLIMTEFNQTVKPEITNP